MNTSYVQSKALLVSAFLFVIIVDQVTKGLASPSEGLVLIPGFLTFVHLLNQSFFWFGSRPAIWFTSAVVLLIFIFAIRRYREMTSREGLAFALILGGGIANLVDQIRFGGVYDILQFGALGIINIADIAIALGIVLFCIDAWRRPRTEA